MKQVEHKDSMEVFYTSSLHTFELMYCMLECFSEVAPEALLGSSTPCMDRPLAIGGISGLASSLLVTLARNFALEAQEQGLPLPTCIPSCFDSPGINLEEAPWIWFVAGLVTGLSVGPLVDLLWLWKQRWRRYVLSEAASGGNSQRALHKVLA